jgi:hypothetical protein
MMIKPAKTISTIAQAGILPFGSGGKSGGVLSISPP